MAAAALDCHGERLLGALRASMAVSQDPAARLHAAFDVIGQVAADPGYRGCPYLNAAAQTPEPTAAVHAQVRAHKDLLHAIFRAELVRAGHPEPHDGADELLLLLDGALVESATRPDREPHPHRPAARRPRGAALLNATPGSL